MKPGHQLRPSKTSMVSLTRNPGAGAGRNDYPRAKIGYAGRADVEVDGGDELMAIFDLGRRGWGLGSGRTAARKNGGWIRTTIDPRG